MLQQAQLPVNLGFWLLALAPIAVLLVLLVGLRWGAAQAGTMGMFAAALVALLALRTPASTLAAAGANGVWDSVFILLVIWPALLLYRVTERAGALDALRRGIQQFSRNDLFLVLTFGWVFASFLQGMAGFGAPIAVVAPLLVAIGVRPTFAVVIPLIGHAWAKMFGTLAVGWLATLQVVTVENPTTTAFESAALLWIANLMGGLGIAWLYGRMAAIRHALPMILLVTLLHGGLQLVITLWNPVLSAFLAATAALVVVYPLSHWRRYSEPHAELAGSPVMVAGGEHASGVEEDEGPSMGLGIALLPYVVLTGVALVVLLIPAVEGALSALEVGLPFPEVSTGYGIVREAQEPYSPFAPFTHPGAFLLVAALVAWLMHRARGDYEARRERSGEGAIWPAVVHDAVPSSVSVTAFLVTSRIMDHSGQTTLLAQGVAAVAPPVIYAFASNWIGVLGAFITSSSTASNVLFAPLQEAVAELEEALPEPTVVAAQSAGGAIGNVIAPANVVLGNSTAGNRGGEGDVLRVTLVWMVITAVLIGVGTVLRVVL